MLALALCSTNMPLQTIFAEEFTSGNSDVVSEEETPEIFTNEEQEAAGETNEDLFVFSTEEAPEFNDTPDEAMAATENAQNGVIDFTNNIAGVVYTIISADCAPLLAAVVFMHSLFYQFDTLFCIVHAFQPPSTKTVLKVLSLI